MSFRTRTGRRLAAVTLAFGLIIATFGGVSAHARYDHSDPASGAVLDGSPFVLRTYFSQELMKASTIRVVDVTGTQVDLGDGRVDTDDPDRKLMIVSLPSLQQGVYTVQWNSVSAEDGDAETGTFMFGVGVAPPSADAPTQDDNSASGT
jgi:copper transport protein